VNETPQQYMQRIQGHLAGADPLVVLEATADRLARVVQGKSSDILHRRPSPERWSVAEIVMHLAEAELVIAYRVRIILEKNGVPIPAFDQDVWARRYRDAQIKPALEMHRGLRQANLALYRSFSPEQWEQYGMHSERGKESIRKIVNLAAGNDLNHMKQIEEILAPS